MALPGVASSRVLHAGKALTNVRPRDYCPLVRPKLDAREGVRAFAGQEKFGRSNVDKPTLEKPIVGGWDCLLVLPRAQRWELPGMDYEQLVGATEWSDVDESMQASHLYMKGTR